MPSTHATKPAAPRTARPTKAAPAGSPQATAAQAPAATLNEDEKRDVLIRLAAYAFYERRGCLPGHDLEDWLQAEMEVDRQLAERTGPAQEA